jgi:hypothetical protein
VWLASVSHSERGVLVPAGEWVHSAIGSLGERLLDKALLGRGDSTMQRGFRMNITLCRHRVVTDKEIAMLPPEWHDSPPVDIAGGPVEILWATGMMPTSPAVYPCENPGRRLIAQLADPRLWIPEDCGACPPCVARAAS